MHQCLDTLVLDQIFDSAIDWVCRQDYINEGLVVFLNEGEDGELAHQALNIHSAPFKKKTSFCKFDCIQLCKQNNILDKLWYSLFYSAGYGPLATTSIRRN